MQGHAISFWFIYREGENATELQPGWNSISKRSVVGTGEFVSVSQLAGLDTKASPWPQEWLKLQTCAKALARRGPLRGAAVVTPEPAPGWPLCPTAAAVSRCYFLTQMANSSLDSITKLSLKPSKAALALPFNPSPHPSVLQSNLAEKEGRFYDARAQLSSNWHLWEMDQSQNMTKTLAGGNMLICLKNTSSQDKTVSPHPHAA